MERPEVIPRERIPWIDAARAFAIVLVVFGHVLRGIHDAGLIADGKAFRLLDDGIYLFHMLRWSRLFGQLFGFLSGNPVQFVVEAVGM